MQHILYQYFPNDKCLSEIQEKYATKHCIYLKSVDDDLGLVQFSDRYRMVVNDLDLQEVLFCEKKVIVQA